MTLWAVAHQDPLSLGLSRWEYRSGLPFPPPGDLPDPGIEPASPESPALWADYLPLSLQEAREAQRPQTASESLLHLAVSQYRQVKSGQWLPKDRTQATKDKEILTSPWPLYPLLEGITCMFYATEAEVRPQVRAQSKSRATSEIRGCQSFLRPKVFSLYIYIQDTQIASRERERNSRSPFEGWRLCPSYTGSQRVPPIQCPLSDSPQEGFGDVALV